MFRCADAEQVQATGKHRPGSLGKGQPGTVGGQGFLLAARQGRARVVEAEEGVGGGLEVPGEPVGGAVAGGGFEEAGVVAEEGEEGEGGGVVVSAVDAGTNPKINRIPEEAANPGMGVPHAEQRIALALGEEPTGIEIGQIVRGGPEQHPTSGIRPKPPQQLLSTDPGGPHGKHLTPAGDLALPPTNTHKPPHDGPDQHPTHLPRRREPHQGPGQSIRAPVVLAALQHVAYERGMPAGIDGDVQKPGPGDLHPGDPRRNHQPPQQHLGHPQGDRRPPAIDTPGKLKRHISRIIPTPRPRRSLHLHPLRQHSHPQLVGLDGTAHGLQHGAGELGGCHGTSVWEEGGVPANGFRPSDGEQASGKAS